MWGITRVYSGTVIVSHIHNLFLYADDSCFVFQGKDIIQIEKQLKILQTSVNGLQIIDFSIHFGEHKTKSLLFASKCKIKRVPKLKIKYKNIQIKQHSKVTYLGCILDETMSGESMVLKVINKINSTPKFLHRKNKFLTPALRRLLCNALIQPQLDYASSAWYPNLTQKMTARQNDPYFQKLLTGYLLKTDSINP